MSREKKRQIFVLGAYGCGNKGDDTILQAIHSLFEDYRIVATCGAYNDISEEIPVRTVRCRLNEGFSVPVLLSLAFNSLKMAYEIARSDAFFFGGGALIHDLSSYNLPFMFLWHRIARLLGKKVYYLCIGIGPVKTERGKKACAKWLSAADGLSVRDRRGYDICSSLGIKDHKLVCDAAFTYQQRNQNPGETLERYGLPARKYVCVTASNWLNNENYFKQNNDAKNDDSFAREYALSLKAVSDTFGYKLVFLPSEARDEIIGKQLSQYLNNEMICLPDGLSCSEIAAVTENCRLMIGMRMHPMIYCLRQNIPVLALSYDQKVTEMMNLLGLSPYVISLRQVNAELILQKTKDIEGNMDEIVKTIEENVRNYVSETNAAVAGIKNELGA